LTNEIGEFSEIMNLAIEDAAKTDVLNLEVKKEFLRTHERHFKVIGRCILSDINDLFLEPNSENLNSLKENTLALIGLINSINPNELI